MRIAWITMVMLTLYNPNEFQLKIKMRECVAKLC